MASEEKTETVIKSVNKLKNFVSIRIWYLSTIDVVSFKYWLSLTSFYLKLKKTELNIIPNLDELAQKLLEANVEVEDDKSDKYKEICNGIKRVSGLDGIGSISGTDGMGSMGGK